MSSNSLLLTLAEGTAVILAVLYLLLAVRQHILCWLCWIISSCLYLYVMYEAGLYMESMLQIFYIIMGFYGWSQWNRSGDQGSFQVNRWSRLNHLIAMAVILMLTFASGQVLELYTEAAMPFIDALTTWGAVVTTYMVAKKLLENWIYWFVIDSISIYLFVSRELYFTAFLFLVYLFIIVIGYRSWREMESTANETNL